MHCFREWGAAFGRPRGAEGRSDALSCLLADRIRYFHIEYNRLRPIATDQSHKIRQTVPDRLASLFPNFLALAVHKYN
jgi:hypothetical protein